MYEKTQQLSIGRTQSSRKITGLVRYNPENITTFYSKQHEYEYILTFHWKLKQQNVDGNQNASSSNTTTRGQHESQNSTCEANVIWHFQLKQILKLYLIAVAVVVIATAMAGLG